MSKATNIQETIEIIYKNYFSIFLEYSHPEYRQWKFRKYGMRLSKMEFILKQLTGEMTSQIENQAQMPVIDLQLGHLRADLEFKDRRNRFLKENSKKTDQKTVIFWGDGQFNTNFNKNNDITKTVMRNGMEMEYRLRKCTFCLDLHRPHLFERDVSSSNFILKRGMQLMKTNGTQILGIS